MKSHRTYILLRAVILLGLLLVHAGCSTFQSIGTERPLSDIKPMEQKLQIVASDGLRYVFPIGQYRIEGDDEAGWKVVGWGEQYGQFGLMGSHFYVVPVRTGTLVQTEEIDVLRSVLYAGVFSTITVVTFLGIQSLSSSSDKSGGGSRPPADN